MIDYIKEMMETVKIRPKRPCDLCNNCDGTLYSCGELPESYPDFTSEKQLEIFQLIHQADYIDYITSYVDEIRKEYVFKALLVCEFSSEEPIMHYARNQDFAQALAQLTTKLIKAGKLDKEKVKEILEK